jgi:hypothetical protein
MMAGGSFVYRNVPDCGVLHIVEDEYGGNVSRL